MNPDVYNEHYLFNYETIFSSIYTLFILSTLDNFPDLILWVYSNRPEMMVFYYIFTIFTSIVMISVLTGVFYTNFKEFYSAGVSEQMKLKEYRDLIKECLQDDILNFDKIKLNLENFVQELRDKHDQQRERKIRAKKLLKK